MDRLLVHGLEYFGLYYGTYRAVVISNEDEQNSGQPDPQGRLQIRVPSVGDTQDAVRIAYPITPLAGDGYGFKSLPPSGSQVYVEFERGRLDMPLWKGMWWARNEIPQDLRPVDAHGWFTPGGHQLLLDDQDGSEVIRIKHSDGETRVELDAQGNIFIVNKQGQKVNIGDGADTANEPAALGNTLKSKLEDLTDAIINLTVPTPAGPSGQPINRPQFEAIKGQLQQILSQTVNVK